MGKTTDAITNRWQWLEKEIENLRNIKTSSLHTESFIGGKLFAYEEEKHFLENLLTTIKNRDLN